MVLDEVEKWCLAQEDHTLHIYGTSRTIDWSLFDRYIPRPPCRVVDLGMNGGYVVRELVERGYDACGVDLPRLAQRAREELPEVADRLLDCNLEVEEIPVPHGRYDMVLATGVMEHLMNWDKFLGKVYRSMGFMATLFMTTCDSRGREIETYHAKHFTSEELIEVAGLARLETVRVWKTSSTNLIGLFKRLLP